MVRVGTRGAETRSEPRAWQPENPGFLPGAGISEGLCGFLLCLGHRESGESCESEKRRIRKAGSKEVSMRPSFLKFLLSSFKKIRGIRLIRGFLPGR
jgi:hypothetical protein